MGHRHLMHRKRLPLWAYGRFPYLLDVFEAHAVRHHARWYRQFDFEPDPIGRCDNIGFEWSTTLRLVAGFALVWGPLAWWAPAGAVVFIAGAVLHNRIHNMLHRQMHVPRRVFYGRWVVYRWLARQHFLHHRHVRANFNLSFPLFDHVFRSTARPTQGDIREMLLLGLLEPRSHQAATRVRRIRAQCARSGSELSGKVVPPTALGNRLRGWVCVTNVTGESYRLGLKKKARLLGRKPRSVEEMAVDA